MNTRIQTWVLCFVIAIWIQLISRYARKVKMHLDDDWKSLCSTTKDLFKRFTRGEHMDEYSLQCKDKEQPT